MKALKKKASLFIILCTEKNFDLQQCSLKEGGRYEIVSGMIRKLDVGIGYLFLMDGQKIRIQDIFSVKLIDTKES